MTALPTMPLSDAIEAGAALLATRGPTFNYGDCMAAAFAGMHQRIPDEHDPEFREFCWDNPWTLTENDGQLGYCLRLFAIHGVRWHEVLDWLRKRGF